MHKKLIDGDVSIEPVINWLRLMIAKGLPGGAVEVSIGRPEETGTPEQGSKFHAMIGDIVKQAVFKMPGKTVRMSDYDAEEAKSLLVRWFERECAQMNEPLRHGSRVVICPFTGEKITIRASTTKFLKVEKINFIEWLYLTGADGGVDWSEKALVEYQTYRQA